VVGVVKAGSEKALGRLENLQQAGRRLEFAQRIRSDPLEIVEFLVQRWLARAPMRGERQDHKMPAALSRRHDFTPGGKACDLDCQRGFLGDLAMERGVKGFTEFDATAGQRVKSLRWRARTPHHQHLALAENRRTDRKLGTGWKERRQNGIRDEVFTWDLLILAQWSDPLHRDRR
jgi:hypothetical protein